MQWWRSGSMVDGLAPNIAYYPVAALAALTAALVTLLVAVSAWKKSLGNDAAAESAPGSPRGSSESAPPSDSSQAQGSASEQSSPLERCAFSWTHFDEGVFPGEGGPEEPDTSLAEALRSRRKQPQQVEFESKVSLLEEFLRRDSEGGNQPNYGELLASGSHEAIPEEHYQLNSGETAPEVVTREIDASIDEKPAENRTAKSGLSGGPLDQLRSQTYLKSVTCEAQNTDKEIDSENADHELVANGVQNAVPDMEKSGAGEPDDVYPEDLINHEYPDETEARGNTMPQGGTDRQVPPDERNNHLDDWSAFQPASGKTDDSNLPDDDGPTELGHESLIENIDEERNAGNRDVSENGSDGALAEALQCRPDDMRQPLNTVFYLYDMAEEINKRAEFAVTGESPFATVDPVMIEDLLKPDDVSLSRETTGAAEENNCLGSHNKQRSVKRPSDQNAKIRDDIVERKVEEDDADPRTVADDKDEVPGTLLDALAAQRDGGSASESPMSDGETSEPGKVRESEEENAVPRSSPSSAEGREEAQPRKQEPRRAAERDNSAEGSSCSPYAGRVTSAGPDAEHLGTARAVQGSCREELIAKACSEFPIATESRRRRGLSESPAYDGRTTMPMADHAGTSWGDHDSRADRAITAERFGRLDELVDHLRRLAGCDPREDSNVNTAPLPHRATVGLLSDYYADKPDLGDVYFASELGASDASNYGSDSSQSLCLSSISGETGSSFSLRADSPRAAVHEDLVRDQERDSVPEHQQPENLARLSDSFGSDSAYSYISGESAAATPQHQHKGNVYIPEPSITNSLSDETCSGIKSVKDDVPATAFSSSSSVESLTSLKSAVEESSRQIEELLRSRYLSTMEDSPRKLRLQKLLERDKERRDRLSQLSGHGIGIPNTHNHSTVANDYPECTLEAIESAIGHMRQLIREEESSECYGNRHEPHTNELHSSERTIGPRETTEVQMVSEISLENCHTMNNVGKSSETKSFFSEEAKPSGEIFPERYSPEKSSPIRPESRAGLAGSKESDDWESLMHNVIHNISDYRTCEEEIAGSMRDCTVLESESVVVESTSRWRAGGESVEVRETVADEWKRTIDPPGAKCFPDNAEGPQMRPKAIDLCSTINQKTLLKINLPRAESGECRWGRRARADVTPRAAQSAEEPRDQAPQPSPPPFSDDLRAEPDMESGGCDATSPPAAAGATTTPTPTKIKNLRFKLDPDIFDLPSENGYYPDEDYNRRPGWRKQTKYNTFSSLELGRGREPVKVVSVRTSVVPAGTKMVVKPVCVSEGQPSKAPETDDSRVTVKKLDIDLRIRLETQEPGKDSRPTGEAVVDVVRGEWRASPDRQSKRSYLSSSPSQSKRRSPVPDFSGWNQSLSPVSENCDWVAVPSTSPEAGQLSTSSDPGQRGKVFSACDAPHSFSFDNSSFSVCDREPEKVADSFPEDGGQQTDLHDTSESRDPETHTQSSDVPSENFFDRAFTSTPSRPSTLELNHFRKHLQLPRKKFVPDPEAVERITGFKAAEEKSSTKPPLPPSIRSLPSSHRLSSGAKNRIDQLRKRYLDSKHLLAAQKLDSSAKFEKFLNSAQEDRAKLATSTPDLAAFEAAVRNQWSKARNEAAKSKENSPPSDNPGSGAAPRSATPDEVWVNYVQLLRRQLNRRSQSMSYLETDVDSFFAEDVSRSTMTLERSPPSSTQSLVMPSKKSNRISVSLEESGRTKSEHELRIEKSLQSMNLPEWYKHSERPKSGFILEKKSDVKRGWAAVKSLTSSTTSLVSSGSKPRRPARSLRTSHENLMWSRGSASPASADNSYNRFSKTTSGPVLSLALAKAFREPYVGWRARTPSSCATPSPQVDCSPPSWVVMDNTDRSDTPLTSDLQAMDEEEDTGLSFNGEDVLEDAGSSSRVVPIKLNGVGSPPPSADDTCNDIVNISMDTFDHPYGQQDDSKSFDLPGEDTCDDIKNITMDTFELFPPNANEEHKTSPVGDDTCDDVLNISTDTSSQKNLVPNGNQATSSVVGVTENTALDIDDISTDTSNIVVQQPVTNGNRDSDIHARNGNCESVSLHSTSYNANETDQSLSSNVVDSSCERITVPQHLVNGNHDLSHEDAKVNGNSNVFISPPDQPHLNGNSNSTNHHIDDSPPVKFEPKRLEDRSKLDSKRKRYSYNRSIYQNELDGEKARDLNLNRNDLDGSSQSLPGEHNSRDDNKVIWIESSFVGSRTTTSIVVLPTETVVKDCAKGSTGSNTSVGRPASR